MLLLGDTRRYTRGAIAMLSTLAQLAAACLLYTSRCV